MSLTWATPTQISLFLGVDLRDLRIHPALQPLRGLLLIHATHFNIALEEYYLFIFREV